MSNRTHKIILCAAALACAAAILPGGAAAAPAYQYDQYLSAWVHASVESATLYQGTFTKHVPSPSMCAAIPTGRRSRTCFCERATRRGRRVQRSPTTSGLATAATAGR
jgi:hypothetical protein